MGRVLVSSPTVRRDPAKVSAEDRPAEPLVEGAAFLVEPSPPPAEVSGLTTANTPAQGRRTLDAAAGREGRDLVERQHAQTTSARRTSVRQLRRQRQVAAQDLQLDAENLAKIAGPGRPRRINAWALYVRGPRARALQVTPGAIPQSAIGRSMFSRSSTTSFEPGAPIEPATGRRSRARMPHHREAINDLAGSVFGSYVVT